MLKPGDKAPTFKLPGHDGKTHSLKDYLGQTVVLYFYPKDMTSGCTTQACDFTAAKAKFTKKDTVILGVSKDSVARHVKFIAKDNLKITLLSDEEGVACQAYGVWKEKSMYGKKYMGIARKTFLIDKNGVLQKIWPAVKIDGHVEEVLSSIREMKA